MIGWFVGYLWLMGMTEGLGAPWDIAPVRPPLGHWQRTLNDFFESAPGMYLPTIIFFGVEICLYMYTVIRTQTVKIASLVFGLSIIVAMNVNVLIALPIRQFFIRIPAHLTPADWLYHGDFRREWPLSLVGLAIIVILFWVQPRIVGYVVATQKN